MFATEIANVCIVQPHHTVVCWIFKFSDIKDSDKCAEYLCIREDERCQDRNWVVAKQPCKFAGEMAN